MKARKERNPNGNNPRVRINLVLKGELAEYLISWRRRGLIKSYSDGIAQALRVLHEKITEMDMKALQLKNLRRVDGEW